MSATALDCAIKYCIEYLQPQQYAALQDLQQLLALAQAPQPQQLAALALLDKAQRRYNRAASKALRQYLQDMQAAAEICSRQPQQN